jgi:signal transduction histidine kinase
MTAQRWVRRHEWVRQDLTVVVGVLAVSCAPYLANRLDLPGKHFPLGPAWTYTFVALASAGLLVRRRWPLVTVCWVLACALPTMIFANGPGATMIPGTVALYSVSLRASRARWLAAGALVLVTLGVAEAVAGDWWEVIRDILAMCTPLAVGQAVRNRRAYVAEMEERARRAEATKDREAHRAVAEERIRIARELHDVLAHSIAVISVQSGMAAHIIRTQPEQAEQALWHINDASHAALAELRATLDLLRQDGDPTAPTGPPPGLGQLTELIDPVVAAGITVRTHLPDGIPRVPAELGLVAYRVVQEALTNVLKHAQAGSVDITLAVTGTSLTLEIRDDGVGGPPGVWPVGGHGRLGMRERIHALGGTFADGPVNPGWRVRAVLPLSTTAQDVA